MIKLFKSAAVSVIALAATVGIAGEPAKRFVHRGVTYVYDATPAADGSTVLTGHALPGGAKFRLVVRNGQVTGRAGRRDVNFSVAGSRGASSGAVVSKLPVRLSSLD